MGTRKKKRPDTLGDIKGKAVDAKAANQVIGGADSINALRTLSSLQAAKAAESVTQVAASQRADLE